MTTFTEGEADRSGSGSPAAQRVDEWRDIDKAAYDYHLMQWMEQKQSTKHFADFIGSSLATSRRVIDLGCGGGAATFYLAQQNPNTQVLGIDYSADLVALAGKLAADNNASNLQFGTGDWFDLSTRNDVDGVVSLQTLSWLPEFERPLSEIFHKLNPQWVGLTSLFYEGDISCTIEVNEHARDRRSFYNVYSIPALARYVGKHGYKISRQSRFLIDVDIKKPDSSDSMGTYTVPLKEGPDSRSERLQISGPLLMNWYFLLIEKN